MFADSSCYLIHLVDPSLIQREEFGIGGWDYHATYSDPNKVAFVVGENSEPMTDSPVWSADYSISKINTALYSFGFT